MILNATVDDEPILKAIQAGIDGQDVVISTSTASGKSLCYQTLTAHHLAMPGATMLYLAPINALILDQMDAFESFFLGGKSIPQRFEYQREAYLRRVPIGDRNLHIARYDSGVPDDDRKAIRQAKPQILLTNPEMLIRGILTRAHANKGPEIKAYGNTAEWAYFFKGLRFIVIDELHAFRGVFGAHLANILRRVRRMVALCGGDASRVRYFACSATIRDPAATGRAVLGVTKLTVIDDKQNGAPRYRRSLIAIDSRGEKLESIAARLIPQMALKDNARTIVFRDHIPALAGLEKSLKRRYPEARFLFYAASVVAHQRMDRLYQLKSDSVDAILATSALELGIDVGSLNASVLLGYPRTIAKTWQMLGRAGRNGPGLLVYVAGPNYLDQYWLSHLDELVGDKAQPEDIVIEPDNPYVVAEHVRGAAYDHVLEEERDAKDR